MYKRTAKPNAHRWIMEFPGSDDYSISSDRDILIGELFKKFHPEYKDMNARTIMRRFGGKAYEFYRQMERDNEVSIEVFD